MPYRIEPVTNDKYVILMLTGKVTLNEHNRSTDDVISSLTTNNWHRLLVDCTEADHKMPVVQTYEFAKTLDSRHRPGTRIAALVHPEDFEHVKFVENVARNRGVNFTLFAEKAPALQWLLEDTISD